MTHRDGFPRLSARSAWRGDAGHRKPCAPSESHGPSESLGEPPFRSRRRTGSGRIGGGAGKPRRCPAGPAASLLPARWPDGSPARSLWVIISASWYKPIRAAVGNQRKFLIGLSYLQFGYLGLLEQHIGSVWAFELRLPSVCYYT